MKRSPFAVARGVLAVLVLAALAPVAFAQAPPGDQLIDRVLKAYRALEHYDATARFKLIQTQGRWTYQQAGDFHIAVDRPANRLRLDAPDQTAVADGSTLFYRHTQMPGKHLEVATATPLTCEWLIQQAPDLLAPAFPTDLAFLLADDPLAFISQGAAGSPATLPPDPADPGKRPRLECALQGGTMVLTINPATHLIDRITIDADTASMGMAAGASLQFVFEFDVHGAGQPVADEHFAFDTTGSVASESMQHMMASGSNAPHPLQGKPTPALNLPDLEGIDHDLAVDDRDAKVIVLDFWATWCPPCVAALPELQKVYDWALAEGKPVAIYAVNQGETAEEVKQFWAEHSLSIPVLMDENFTAAQSFAVSGIPQTVVIAGGKVRHVHVGFAPGIGEQLKAEIEALLKE